MVEEEDKKVSQEEQAPQDEQASTPEVTRAEEAEVPGVVVRCSPQLNGEQRRFLRSMGHHVRPTVLIGDKGLHGNVYKQIRQGMLDHELIKLRWRGADAEERKDGASRIHDQTGAQIVQILGKTMLLYKEHPENPKIRLPRRRKRKGRA